MLRVGALLTLASMSGPVEAHETMIFETNSDEDWCSVINETAMPGDIIRLAPGDYYGPCVISRTPPDEQDEYTIVMSLDPEEPARILHDGESAIQLTVEGDQVMLLSLDFGPVPEGVIPVEVLGHREIWIRYNRFSEHSGTAVKVSSAVDGLHILDNDFDGVALPVDLDLGEDGSWVDLGYNRIREATTGARARGSWRGWVRENVLWDVETGFDLEASGEVEVRGNWLRFLQQGLVLAAETAEIQANILHGAGHGMVLGQASSAGTYSVRGNSLVTDTSPSILAQGASAEVVTLGNLSLQEIQGGQGNVFCEAPEDCWTDVDAGSYYPVLDPTVVASDAGDLGVDFCGRERSEPQWAGGLEAACLGDPESFDFDFKRNFQCTYADLSGANESCHLNEEDTGGGEDTGGDGGGDSNEACTCSAQQPKSSRGWLLTVGLWILWRGQLRSRSTRST